MIEKKHTEYILGIHLLLSDEVSEIINKTKKELGLEYIANYSFTPHITLYLSRFPKDSFDLFTKELKKQKFKQFLVTILDIDQKNHIESQDIFVSIKIKNSKELQNCHRKIVEIANVFRKNLIRTKDKKRIQEGKYSNEEVKKIEKYGYVRVLDGFDPHITLGLISKKYNKENNIKQKLQIALKDLLHTTTTASRLIVGLYEYDVQKGIFLDQHFSIEKTINFK